MGVQEKLQLIATMSCHPMRRQAYQLLMGALALLSIAFSFTFQGPVLYDIEGSVVGFAADATRIDGEQQRAELSLQHPEYDFESIKRKISAVPPPLNLTSTNPPPNRILLGLFTTTREQDKPRQNLVRKTYLTNYEILNQVGLAKSDETTDRLCSLADLLEQKNNTMQECVIVYTFVAGNYHKKSNLSIPTDLTYIDDASFPYAVDRSSEEGYNRDFVYLNIRENMNDGKTSTWFKYASTILPAKELGIDLIAKVDSDTVLYPRPLLHELDRTLSRKYKISRPAQRVYGGFEEVAHPEEVPYAQGGFYFLSRDVASYITSSACPRYEILPYEKAVLSGHGVDLERAEDLETGLLVDHCWNNHSDFPPVRRVLLDPYLAGDHDRQFKNSRGFRVKWKGGLARDLAFLRLEQLSKKYPGGCPTTAEELAIELKWFDERPGMILTKDRFSKHCEKLLGGNESSTHAS